VRSNRVSRMPAPHMDAASPEHGILQSAWLAGTLSESITGPHQHSRPGGEDLDMSVCEDLGNPPTYSTQDQHIDSHRRAQHTWHMSLRHHHGPALVRGGRRHQYSSRDTSIPPEWHSDLAVPEPRDGAMGLRILDFLVSRERQVQTKQESDEEP
jgi:hypothetical protein